MSITESYVVRSKVPSTLRLVGKSVESQGVLESCASHVLLPHRPDPADNVRLECKMLRRQLGIANYLGGFQRFLG